MVEWSSNFYNVYIRPKGRECNRKQNARLKSSNEQSSWNINSVDLSEKLNRSKNLPKPLKQKQIPKDVCICFSLHWWARYCQIQKLSSGNWSLICKTAESNFDKILVLPVHQDQEHPVGTKAAKAKLEKIFYILVLKIFLLTLS